MARSRGSEVSPAIENLSEFPPERVRTALNTAYQDQKNTSNQKLALAHSCWPSLDRSNARFLLDAVSTVPSEEVDNVATARWHD